MPALAQIHADREAAGRLLREAKYADAVARYRDLTARNPYDGALWGNLGYCLHAQKQFAAAIPAYEKAVALGHSPDTNLYNLACAHALSGGKDEAFAFLTKALQARFAQQETLATDTDLDVLRSDPRFAALTGLIGRLDKPLATTREAGWCWDLDFCLRRMRQMHYDLFGKVAESAVRAEIDKLKAEVAALSDDDVRLRLRKITASIGDGHTQASLQADGVTTVLRLPLHMFVFRDGLGVLGAGKEHAALAGARVLRVGALAADAALQAVRPYIAVDNEMGYLAAAPTMLTHPTVLAAIGAGKDPAGVDFTFATPDGKESTVRIAPVETPLRRQGGRLVPGFAYAHAASAAPLPLYLRAPDKRLRTEHDAGRKLLYFWFGAVQDDGAVPFGEFVDAMFAAIAEHGVERLVIDMRFNGGGNTGLLRPLLHGLIACKAVNRPGHLYVIVGRHTFSAAQNAVNLLDAHTAATFVGEPTGSCPQFIGESTWFLLPHSNTRVTCSSRYWQHMDSTDRRCWVAPEIVAELSLDDYLANRDPALQAIYAELGAR